MSPSPRPTFTPETAQAFLKPFACVEADAPWSDQQYPPIRAALMALTQVSDYATLGVCADHWEEGMKSLRSYLEGLGYSGPVDGPHVLQEGQPQASCYLKYNTRRQTLYLEPYGRKYRGVLVCFQSDYANGFVGTYGHFPLNLFE
jgi:hypothetical protein